MSCIASNGPCSVAVYSVLLLDKCKRLEHAVRQALAPLGWRHPCDSSRRCRHEHADVLRCVRLLVPIAVHHPVLPGWYVSFIFNRILAHSHLTNLCSWCSVGEVQLLDAFPVLARLSDATEVAKYSFLVTPQVCRSHIILVCCRCVV